MKENKYCKKKPEKMIAGDHEVYKQSRSKLKRNKNLEKKKAQMTVELNQL